jgi:DNA-binding CsgD family transcriptional regulator
LGHRSGRSCATRGAGRWETFPGHSKTRAVQTWRRAALGTRREGRRSAAPRLEQQIKPPDDQPTLTLTAREREVLTWISLGKFAWEIGEILGIAKRTVDEHTQAAARKLGASNRTQAVAIAIRDCLIDL